MNSSPHSNTLPLTGSLVALVTPMKTQAPFAIDWQAFERLLDFHLEAGTHGLVIGGTTGESPTLSAQEIFDLLGFAIQYVKGKMSIIAGAGGNATDKAIEMVQLASECPVDGILSVVPYYNKPTQAGLLAHFTAISHATALPILLYNVPGRTLTTLTLETIAQLGEIPNIVGIKEASGDCAFGVAIRERLGDDFILLSGDDSTYCQLATQAGAQGVISVTANVAPKLVATLAEALKQNDLTTATAIDEKLTPLYQTLFLEANPIPVKHALTLMELIDQGIRLPLTPLSDNHSSSIKAALDRLNRAS